MARSRPARKSRRLFWVGAAVGALVLLYFLPPFHVVPLKAARQKSAATVFDAGAYVEKFWSGPLLKSADNAVEAAALLAALHQDPADAAKRFGHRLGLSGNSSYFVAGSGRIVGVENNTITIASQEGGPAEVVIDMGPVFGNAIRDGSGLLDVSDFPNAQDFNALSSEINRRVEERVFPLLKEKAAVGAAVRFAGGVEIADEEAVPSALHLVPVLIEFP